MSDEKKEETPDKVDDSVPDGLWIKEGSNEVISTIYIYRDKKNQLRSILLEPNPNLLELQYSEYVVETRWCIPTSAQLKTYRDNSLKYNPISRTTVIQKDLLQTQLVQNHLIEIKLGDQALDLPRDDQGKITKKGMELLGRLHPSVTDLMYFKFAEDASLLI